MHPFSVEHSRAAYIADFFLYGITVSLLGTYLLLNAPLVQRFDVWLCVVLGLLSWTAIEYVLHRFVLHTLPIFRDMHAEHHARPTALICTPTMISSVLIGALVLLPAWLSIETLRAWGLTLGVLAGYLAYAITHHAIHHWRGGGAWMMRRKRWHAIHHRLGKPSACYGVTTVFWDHVFRTGWVGHRTDAQHAAPTPYKPDPSTLCASNNRSQVNDIAPHQAPLESCGSQLASCHPLRARPKLLLRWPLRGPVTLEPGRGEHHPAANRKRPVSGQHPS